MPKGGKFFSSFFSSLRETARRQDGTRALFKPRAALPARPDAPVVMHEYSVIEDISVMDDHAHYQRAGLAGVLETSQVGTSNEIGLREEVLDATADWEIQAGLKLLANLRQNDGAGIERTATPGLPARNPMIGAEELAQAARAVWEKDCAAYGRMAADGKIEVHELARAVTALHLRPADILAASSTGVPVVRIEHKRGQISGK